MVRFLADSGDFSFLQILHINSGAQQASYWAVPDGSASRNMAAGA